MSTPGYRTGWVFRFKSFRCWHHLLGFFWLIRAVSSHPLAILRGGGGELFLILYSSSSLASVGFSPPSYNRWASPSFLRCCCCIFPSKITFLSLSPPYSCVCDVINQESPANTMGSYLELVYNSCASGSQEPLFLCSNPEAAAAADDSMRFVTAPQKFCSWCWRPFCRSIKSRRETWKTQKKR